MTIVKKNRSQKRVFIILIDKIWRGSVKYESRHRGYALKMIPMQLEAHDLPSAIRAADTWIRLKFPNPHILNQLVKRARFRSDPITEAQIKMLKRYKIDLPSDLNKGQAMDLLTRLKFGQLNTWRNQCKKKAKEQTADKKRQDAAVLSRKDSNANP